jgi:hypothetical protein
VSDAEGVAGSVPSTHHDDEERALGIRARDGDPAALDDLLRRLAPELRRFIGAQVRRRGGGRPVDVDEVFQDFQIYLYRRIDRYLDRYPVRTFARALARNVVAWHCFKKSPGPMPLDYQDPEIEDDLVERAIQSRRDAIPDELARAIGLDRFTHAADEEVVAEAFWSLLEVFYRYGGYPHQQLAFAFSILIWGRYKRKAATAAAPAKSKVPVTGDPDRVVREHGARDLFAVNEELHARLLEQLPVDAGELAALRAPLEARLTLSVGELFAKDVASARQFPHLLDRLVESTAMADYFGKDPRQSVSGWTRQVKDRVAKIFADPESARHSLLPAVEVGT